MSALADFHFLRPYWWLALPVLLALLWLMIKSRLGSRSWELVCDTALLPFILTGTSARKRRWSIILIAIGGLLALLSLAGPVWEKLPQPVFTRSNALVLALDMTRSMDAADISPSRLIRARYKIADILKARNDGLTALLVYAGDSFTVTPLTDDAETINSQLGALTTDIMPSQGNNTLQALKLAGQLLKQAGITQGDVLLITDEIDDDDVARYAADLHASGYRVSVLGDGTGQGAPIAQPRGGFLKDSNGHIVIPILAEPPLRKVAAAGGGLYARITPGSEDTDQLLAFFASHGQEGKVENTELKTDTWREQGPWLVLLLLPLLAMLFRRGYLVVFLLFLLPVPRPAQALDWSSLWYRPDQKAQQAFNTGNARAAAQLFRDPAWKGSAQYRSGDFEGAAKSLQQLQDTESLYNRGNAQARLGNYPEAIALYDQVLKKNPEHADARYNKELVEKELQQQQQQNRQQQQQQGKDQQQKDQKQNQQQGQQQDQNQQQADNRQQQSGQDQQQSDQQRQQDQQKQAEQDNQQQQKQQQQQQNESQAQDDQADDKKEQQQELARSDDKPPDENQQATEQWLRRIPDDPAGLLRRKFLYQYQQRETEPPPGGKTW